jgi:hypothetical protein
MVTEHGNHPGILISFPFKPERGCKCCGISGWCIKILAIICSTLDMTGVHHWCLSFGLRAPWCRSHSLSACQFREFWVCHQCQRSRLRACRCLEFWVFHQCQSPRFRTHWCQEFWVCCPCQTCPLRARRCCELWVHRWYPHFWSIFLIYSRNGLQWHFAELRTWLI